MILAAAAVALHHFASFPINRILVLGLVMLSTRAMLSSMDSAFTMVVIHVTAKSSAVTLWHSVPRLSASVVVMIISRAPVVMPVGLVPLFAVPFPVLLGN